LITKPQNVDLQIWTIGHSTRTASEFLVCLQSFDIKMLIDVRRYPGSRKYPHFNAPDLEKYLLEAGITYKHMPALGGRRTPKKDSQNTQWRNAAFRGYADYMETDEFNSAINELIGFASVQRAAYMCSEAVWWSCHRSLISDYLKNKSWTVMHVMKEGQASEHPYTSAYRESQMKLLYFLRFR
jgi:uncharacterized protein (DUF488 family)